MSLRISIGVTILALIVLRLIWRVTHPVAPESYLPGWQRLSSELVHWLLYLLVLATTLSGWLFEAARGWTVSLYGIVPLPRLVEVPGGRGADANDPGVAFVAPAARPARREQRSVASGPIPASPRPPGYSWDNLPMQKMLPDSRLIAGRCWSQHS